MISKSKLLHINSKAATPLYNQQPCSLQNKTIQLKWQCSRSYLQLSDYHHIELKMYVKMNRVTQMQTHSAIAFTTVFKICKHENSFSMLLLGCCVSCLLGYLFCTASLLGSMIHAVPCRVFATTWPPLLTPRTGLLVGAITLGRRCRRSRMTCSSCARRAARRTRRLWHWCWCAFT